jgi:two-component system, cell cycle response regulator DivK
MTEKANHTKENTILIVEDDETSSILLQVFLSQGNYKLLFAVNGKMAVQMFRENPDINLILMDLKMPVLDGYEATRQIRKLNTNIPIIAQSAYAMSGDSEKALKAGCNDYVTKPVKKEELLARINALLK